MGSMNHIEEAARDYAASHAKLEEITKKISDARRRILEKEMPALKQAVVEHSAAYDALFEEVEAGIADGLFIKPKTRAFGVVKVGQKKRPGKIEVPDAETTIGLIRQKLARKAGTLIKRTEGVNKAALATLTVAELASIGCHSVEAVDDPVITVAKSDVAKILDALLSEIEDES